MAKGAALFALIESVKVLLPAEAGEESQASLSDTKVEEVAQHLGITADKVRQLATKSVTSVVPRAFGIKVVDRTAHKELPDDDEKLSFKIAHILEANRPLPASPDIQQFYTVYPDQVAISIEIWEQAGAVASSEPADNNKIGDGLITGLPPLPQESPIDVTFRMNETGLLRVEAVELKNGKEAQDGAAHRRTGRGRGGRSAKRHSALCHQRVTSTRPGTARTFSIRPGRPGTFPRRT